MDNLIGKKFIPKKTFSLDNTIFYSDVLYELVDYEEGEVYNLYFFESDKEKCIFAEQKPNWFFGDYFTTLDQNRVKLINTVLYT